MSTIDLERLIVKRIYFVPMSISEAKTKLFNEMSKNFTERAGLRRWVIIKKTGDYVEYMYDYRHHAISSYFIQKGLDKERKTVQDREAKKFLKELMSKYPKSLFKLVRKIRPNHPDQLHITFKGIEGGCQCKVECLPNLYRRLSQLHEKEIPTEFEIQDAFLTCRRFVENLFESGLSATLILEEKKELLKPTTQLLINDENSHHILHKVEEMLEQATGEVILCGWIGTLLLPKLKEINQKGVNIRMITHKDTELKGKPGHRDVQTAFKGLISMIGKDNISIRPECHCRVVVVDNKALIGSMDINAISLTGSHRELAIYTEDTEIVRNLRKYFNDIFSPLKK